MTDAPKHLWAVIEPDDISAQILGEVYAQQTPEGMVGVPVKYTRADLPPDVKPLEWELTHTKGGMHTYVAPSPYGHTYFKKGWAFEVRETEANFWEVQTDDGVKRYDGDWESAKAWVQGIHNAAALSLLVGGE